MEIRKVVASAADRLLCETGGDHRCSVPELTSALGILARSIAYTELVGAIVKDLLRNVREPQVFRRQMGDRVVVMRDAHEAYLAEGGLESEVEGRVSDARLAECVRLSNGVPTAVQVDHRNSRYGGTQAVASDGHSAAGAAANVGKVTQNCVTEMEVVRGEPAPHQARLIVEMAVNAPTVQICASGGLQVHGPPIKIGGAPEAEHTLAVKDAHESVGVVAVLRLQDPDRLHARHRIASWAALPGLDQ